MIRTMPSFAISLPLIFLTVLTIPRSACGQDEISFNRDIRPILASKCFVCHGPDENHREADLRLDDREAAVDYGAIVPREPKSSLLIERIFSADEELVMPPPESEKQLSPTEQDLLERWIAAGAPYDQHWAFVAPSQTQPPDIKALLRDHPDTPVTPAWPHNEIDQFTLAQMLTAGIAPSPEADRYTLVRRVFLDLIGMPPSLEEADEFVNSDDPRAYEKLVDQLLASPRYGEHWARAWLDLARYSDTNGYEKDRPRSIWPYRDWVIRALNADLPYDQFTIEQLAGDMLPNPTPDQLIATGFHRNTMLNEEGGIDPLEYRYLAMVDRVATTGTVWMGLTVGCAQCHSHKYDPISHTDYYALMGLLNNADEPDFLIPDDDRIRKRRAAETKVRKLEQKLADQFPLPENGTGQGTDAEQRAAHLASELAKWIAATRPQTADWTVVTPAEMSTNLPKLERMDDGSIFSSGDITKRDEFELVFEIQPDQLPIRSLRLEAIPDDRLPDRGPGRTYYEGRKGDFFVSEIDASLDGQELTFAGASHDYQNPNEKNPKKQASAVFDGDGSSGWQPGPHKGERLQLVLNLESAITEPGKLKIKLLFERHYVVSLGRFRFSTSAKADATANRLPEDVESLLASKPQSAWTEEDKSKIQRQFLLTTELLADARKELDAARQAIPQLDHTLVMKERPSDNPRTTHRHHRGEYLSPKEVVAHQHSAGFFRPRCA